MTSATQGDRKPANRRRGKSRGYAGQRGGAHQVSWRDSAEIMERIRVVVYPMWLQRRTLLAILQVVNQWAARQGFEAYALSTVFDDVKRCQTLAAEEQAAVTSKTVEHVAVTRRRLAQLPAPQVAQPAPGEHGDAPVVIEVEPTRVLEPWEEMLDDC